MFIGFYITLVAPRYTFRDKKLGSWGAPVGCINEFKSQSGPVHQQNPRLFREHFKFHHIFDDGYSSLPSLVGQGTI